jgi:hypothetical protein
VALANFQFVLNIQNVLSATVTHPSSPHPDPVASVPPAGTTAARSRIDRAIALVSADLAKVEERLRERMESPIGAIPEVGAHLLAAGGKRLRPLLSVLAARATDISVDLAVSVGCAGELIHTATLYHDDVVDDGRVRRGRPGGPSMPLWIATAAPSDAPFKSPTTSSIVRVTTPRSARRPGTTSWRGS